MFVTVEKDSGQYIIIWNGIDITNQCIRADDEAGIAVVNLRDKDGHFYLDEYKKGTDQEQAASRLLSGEIFIIPGRKMSKRQDITKALRERYPCSAIPHGELATIGTEFGVTREYVRQIANSIGMTDRLSSRKRFVCICGQETHKPNQLCKKCRWVYLPCNYEPCGKILKRSIAVLANRNGREVNTPSGQAIYTGRVFCDRICFGKWFGITHGFGTRERAKQEPKLICFRGHPKRQSPSGKWYCPTCDKKRKEKSD